MTREALWEDGTEQGMIWNDKDNNDDLYQSVTFSTKLLLSLYIHTYILTQVHTPVSSPILKMRKPSHEEIKELVRGH